MGGWAGGLAANRISGLSGLEFGVYLQGKLSRVKTKTPTEFHCSEHHKLSEQTVVGPHLGCSPDTITALNRDCSTPMIKD